MNYEETDNANIEKYNAFAKTNKLLIEKGLIEEYDPAHYAFGCNGSFIIHTKGSTPEVMRKIKKIFPDKSFTKDPHIWTAGENILVSYRMEIENGVYITLWEEYLPENLPEKYQTGKCKLVKRQKTEYSFECELEKN